MFVTTFYVCYYVQVGYVTEIYWVLILNILKDSNPKKVCSEYSQLVSNLIYTPVVRCLKHKIIGK